MEWLSQKRDSKGCGGLRRIWPKKELNIHIYALCWNEEKLLPYFFCHYDSVAARYFIFDNDSTDGSVEILKANPKVTLGRFEIVGDSFVTAALNHYNECWKQSRELANWVIVCNVDEHICHPHLGRYLSRSKDFGISLIIPHGYNMVSDEFPKTKKPLFQTIKYGMREPLWDKPQIFDPNKIDEINFAPGRHTADPVGEVITPRNTRVKLLHYKYLGLEYLSQRHFELRSRLRPLDIENRWGHQYLWDREANTKEYQRVKANSVLVL